MSKSELQKIVNTQVTHATVAELLKAKNGSTVVVTTQAGNKVNLRVTTPTRDSRTNK